MDAYKSAVWQMLGSASSAFSRAGMFLFVAHTFAIGVRAAGADPMKHRLLKAGVKLLLSLVLLLLCTQLPGMLGAFLRASCSVDALLFFGLVVWHLRNGHLTHLFPVVSYSLQQSMTIMQRSTNMIQYVTRFLHLDERPHKKSCLPLFRI